MVTEHTEDSTQWSRLSPWAVAYHSAHSIRKILTNAVTLAPIVVGITQADGWLVPGIAVGLGIAAIVLHAGLSVRRFRYQLLDGRLKVRQGIFEVAQIDLDFSRVQNVSIINPFYFRPLGLVSLTIESAGSSDEEVVLAALRDDHAEHIRQAIAQSRTAAAAITEEQDAEVLITREPRDLVIHGLSSNQAWLVLAGFMGVYSQMPDAWQLDREAFVAALPPGVLASSAVQMVLFAGILLLLGLVVMLALSVLASLLIYGNFELRRVRDGFAARQGAISSRQLNVRQQRIQTVVVRQNWIAKLFMRFNVSFEQISHVQPGGETTGRLMIPAVLIGQSNELTSIAMPLAPSAITRKTESFTKVNTYYLRKRLLWLGLMYGVALVMALAQPAAWAPAALTAITLLIAVAQCRKWRLLGFAIDGDYLTVRSGLIGHNYVVAPLYKVQRITLEQTPFMRRRSLTHLRLYLASRTVVLPCLPEPQANEVANYVLSLIEARPRPWM